MTRQDNTKRHLTSMIITVLAAAAVIWLRSGSDTANMLVNFSVSGVAFSTTDFFVILAAGICGYGYGILIFLGALVAQAIQNGGQITGLFAIMIYLVVALISGMFAEKRWFSKLWKALFVAFDLTVLLGGTWYIMFTQLFTSETIYSGMNIWELCLGAMPESFTAAAVLFLFFRFVPDKYKKHIGIGYLYTEEYERSEEYHNSRHSVLRRQITFMTISEAVLLSLIAVIISNTQLNALVKNQQIQMNQRRMIELSDGQSVGNGYIVSETDTNDEDADAENSDTNSDTEDDTRRYFELSEDQMSRIYGDLAPNSYHIFIMDIQLMFFIVSIALPLGMFFNEIMLRRFVTPIKTLSSAMEGYFSDDEEKRNSVLEKVKNIKTKSEDNEIGQLQTAMQQMVTDMTNHINAVKHEKELEAELKVAEARSDAKSNFLSNMSHEIRTPINAVLGMNEMILRETKEQNIAAYAENVKNAGNTLLGLVNDILDFSKIEAGKMDIIPVDYELSSVLNDLVTMIQNRADAKGLELIVKVDPGIPNRLHGDEIRLKQVVTNILTNAVKYTEKGSVTISAGYEQISSDKIGLRFSVADTGIGIKQEDMDKLFSAFERIEEERNRTIEGTGLGMNITQRLLSMMNSRLEVESVYGSGSTFSFTVEQGIADPEPIGDYEESYRRTLAERKRYKEKFTAPDADVLVVDDTAMNLTVFRSLLKKTKVRIDTASGGDECIEMASEKKYDVIFLDHRMPHKDGIETLKELLQMKDGPNIGTPAVCLTANAVSGAREMYIAAGFTDYLTKPIDPDHLESALLKYLPPEKILPADDADEPEAEAELTGSCTLPEWLLGISMLDVAEGVSHCGDPEIYIETLTVYAQSARSGADEIERCWKERDIENVTIKVHALKSTSRVVGAMRLGDFAERLEKAGNDGDIHTFEKDMDELIANYRALGNALSPLVDTGDDEDLPEMPAEKLEEAYAAIRELAQVFDYDSVTYIMDELSGMRPPAEEKERFERLKEAVSKPDWDMINSVLNS